MNNREKIMAAISAGHETRVAIMAATGLTFAQWRGARSGLIEDGLIAVYKTEKTGTRGRPRGYFQIVENPQPRKKSELPSATSMVRRTVKKLCRQTGPFAGLMV